MKHYQWPNASSSSVPPPKEHLQARRLSTTINMEFGETLKFAMCKTTKVKIYLLKLTNSF
jgi:hypothetical protein